MDAVLKNWEWDRESWGDTDTDAQWPTLVEAEDKDTHSGRSISADTQLWVETAK